jgi:hypothetical protein
MPDFDSIYPKHESEMLQDAYDAISQCELWDWMRTFTPHPNDGFMFSHDPNLTRITDVMKYGHSGASWGWTMRVMEIVAKTGGWEAYRDSIVGKWPKDRPVCPCRAQKGLKIGWCGVAGFGVPGCEH